MKKLLTTRILILLSLTVFLFLPGITKAQINKSTDNNAYIPLIFTPQIKLPIQGSVFNQLSTKVGSYGDGIMTSDLLAKYIKALYDYGLMIGGILAAIVLMGGGVLWLVSAGNDTKITQAKELIGGSVTGLVILFSSWILLNTVNPGLLEMKPIKTEVIKISVIGCCEYPNDNNKKAEMSGSVSCEANKGTFKLNIKNLYGTLFYNVDSITNSCVIPGCCVQRDSENISKCTGTIKSVCNTIKETDSSASFENMPCTEVTPELSRTGDTYSCGGKNMDQCSTASDGEACFSILSQRLDNDKKLWCYNHTCLMGVGKENEVCGNDVGAKCLKNKPSGWSGDWSGGRDCDTGLWCYYP